MIMGRIICCGLGPGDPDLMSVRAAREVRAATHIAYFRKKGRPGQARAIVEGMLAAGVREYPMEYPVTTELAVGSEAYARLLGSFHDAWAERLVELSHTTDVVVLCEGDPFFYGSFMHLYTRLQGRAEVEVIAGIPGMAGCWNVAGLPMTLGDDVLSVLVGTLPEAELEQRARSSDALVIMKTGRNLPKIRRALEAARRPDDAWPTGRGPMSAERGSRPAAVSSSECPYGAIGLAQGTGGRRQEAEA